MVEKASAALGAAIERLNDALLMAEEKLRQRNYGARGELTLPCGAQLIFGKLSGRWGLYATNTEGELQGVTTCSLQVRREAAAAFPQLVLATRAAASGQIAALEEAAEELADFLDHVKDAGPDWPAAVDEWLASKKDT